MPVNICCIYYNFAFYILIFRQFRDTLFKSHEQKPSELNRLISKLNRPARGKIASQSWKIRKSIPIKSSFYLYDHTCTMYLFTCTWELQWTDTEDFSFKLVATLLFLIVSYRFFFAHWSSHSLMKWHSWLNYILYINII